MKQESWLHAHMRCKAGHLSGSLRGGGEGLSHTVSVTEPRDRASSAWVAAAARSKGLLGLHYTSAHAPVAA